MELRDFFPEIEPYRTKHLKVSDLHTVYLEEVGNPEGVPILFLHGGPGGGLSPTYRRFFDPQHYRVVLFDQRGARARARRTPNSRTTPPGTSSAISRRSARTSASGAGSCSAAVGAARWRSLMR
jgi:proline iminopeptidase